MRLKRYLRGLGIGIIVTALIIGISSYSKANSISDEEVMSRARELGMVEQNSERNGQEGTDANNAVNDSLDTVKEENLEADVMEELEVIDEIDMIEDSTVLSELEETETDIQAEENNTTPETGSNDIYTEDENTPGLQDDYVAEFILLTIRSGESSNSVANDLEQLNLIEDAADFDQYLCDFGYATRIHVGDHEIPNGSTYEEIAKILCSNE